MSNPIFFKDAASRDFDLTDVFRICGSAEKYTTRMSALNRRIFVAQCLLLLLLLVPPFLPAVGFRVPDEASQLTILTVLFALILAERWQREKQSLWLTRALILFTGTNDNAAKQEDLIKLFSCRTTEGSGRETTK